MKCNAGLKWFKMKLIFTTFFMYYFGASYYRITEQNKSLGSEDYLV